MILTRLVDDIENTILVVIFILSVLIVSYGVYQIILLYNTQRDLKTSVKSVVNSFGDILATINSLINKFKYIGNDVSNKITELENIFN